VLILGSGPSATELSEIPEDVLVFSCNTGPQLLIEKGFPPKIDVYLASKKGFINYGHGMVELVEKLDITIFLSRTFRYIKKHKLPYKHLIHEQVTNDVRFLKELAGDSMVKEFTNKDVRPSAGIGLLEYALYFKAKEIYIIGIDLSTDTEGHIFDEPKERRYSPHEYADETFVKWSSKHYSNIYCASKNSPLTKIFPHRKLE